MVQAIDRPTEQLEAPDRPDGRSFFTQVEAFYLANRESFISTQALVYQVDGPWANISLFFDHNHAETYALNFMYGDAESQQILNLSITKDGEVESWKIDYDEQGRVEAEAELEPETALKIGNVIILFALRDQAIQESVAKHAEQRQTAAEELAKFMAYQTIVISTQKNHLSRGMHSNIVNEYLDKDKKYTIAEVAVQVDGRIFQEERKKRENRLNNIGFSPVKWPVKPFLGQQELFPGINYHEPAKKI